MEQRLARYYCDVIVRRFGEKYLTILRALNSLEGMRFAQIIDYCAEIEDIKDKKKKSQLIVHVKMVMQCWMRHSLVTLYQLRGKKVIHYMLEKDALLQIDRQPIYYCLVKKNLGPVDALLLKELFLYGELAMTDTIMRVYQRCLREKSSKKSSNEYSTVPTAEELCNAFQRLLENHLIQRSPKNLVLEVEPDLSEAEMALLTTGRAAAKKKTSRITRPTYGVLAASDFLLPPFDVRSYVTQKLLELQDPQSKEESSSEPPTKKFKSSANAFSVAPDVNIYYRPSYQGLMNLWRDAIIVKSAADRLQSPMATHLLRTLLSKTFQNSNNNKGESALLSKIQLVRGLPTELRDMTDSEMHESIHYLAHNSKCPYVTYDSISNPMYCCPYRLVWKSLIDEMTHRVLAEKYGNEGIRCFHAVQSVGKTTLARIEAMTILNSGDVHFSLLELAREGFLRKESFPLPQNQQQTSDITLYCVNEDQIHAILYEYACRSIFNLGQRIAAEQETNRHLVEKETSVNQILALVDEHMAGDDLSEEDKQELLVQRTALEDRISAGERVVLEKYRRMMEKLKVAQQEAIKGLFIIDYYRIWLSQSD